MTPIRSWFVFGVVLLVGCGGGESPRALAMAAHPFCATAMAQVDSFVSAAASLEREAGERSGGTVVVGGITELINGMNAFQTVDINASQHQQFVNLMTLLQVDEELEPVPYLAESWEMSPDGTRLVFRLRDDVLWHDGERTDAYDVAFTYLRATDPETRFPNPAFWDYYVPGSEGVEVVDSFTVAFRLEPHAEALDPWRAQAIMPEHLLGDVAPAELGQHPYGSACPVGNGPYVFVSHRPQESWAFESNPAFPEDLGGPPAPDRLMYRVVPEQTTLLTELLTGAVDVYVAMRPDQASLVLDDPDTELRALQPREYTFVAWNGRRPTLSDPAVRRALTLAVDREAVVDALLRGYGVVAETGVPPYHWAYDPGLEGLPHDPARARVLLEEAGWVDRDGDGVREDSQGRALSLSLIFHAANQDRRTIAELMEAQLREVGVEVTPEGLEGGALAARAIDPTARDFDGLVLSWLPEFRVEESDLFAGDRRDNAFAFAGLQDPVVDSLLGRLQVERDRDAALALWARYQSRILELQPFTYFYFAQRLAGVSSELEGAVMDVRGEWVTAKDWWLDPTASR